MRSRASLFTLVVAAALLGVPPARAAPEPPRLVSGRVVEPGGRAVAFATIEVPELRRATLADSAGQFVLALPPGVHHIRARRMGYEPAETTVRIEFSPAPLPPPVVLELATRTYVAAPVVVRAPRLAPPPAATAPGRYALQRAELDRQIGGLEDVLRTVHAQPGVGAASDLHAEFAVRGSSTTANAILLDGVEVSFPFHILGFNSIFDPGIVESAEFYTGGAPAEYGNSTGGVVALRSRGAVPQSERFAAGISYLSAHVRTAGGGPKLGGAFAARRSHQDQILRLAGSAAGRLVPVFHDVFARGRWQPSARHFLTGGILWAGDGMTLPKPEIAAQDLDFLGVDGPDRAAFLQQFASVRDRLELRNELWVGSLGWRAVLDERAWLETTFGFVPQRFDFALEGDNHEHVTMRSQRTSLGQDLHFGTGTHRAKAGWLVSREDITRRVSAYAGILTLRESNAAINLIDLKERYEFDRSTRRDAAALYVRDEWTLSDRWHMGGGLRFDHDGLTGENLLGPRLAAEWRAAPRLSLRTTLGVHHDRREEPMEVLPTASGAPLEAERSTEFTIGASVQGSGWTAGATTYAKRLSHLVYEPEPALYANGGIGRAVGLEIAGGWQARHGRRRAQLSYGWSRVRQEDPVAWRRAPNYRATEADSFWGPVYEPPYAYRPAQDQPHRLAFDGSLRWRRWDFGMRYQLASGRPYTPVEWVATDPLDLKYGIVADKGSARYPAFQRLDLRVQRTIDHGRWHYRFYADVLNVTGRDNVFQYRYDSRYRVRYAVKMLPILPAVGFEASF